MFPCIFSGSWWIKIEMGAHNYVNVDLIDRMTRGGWFEPVAKQSKWREACSAAQTLWFPAAYLLAVSTCGHLTTHPCPAPRLGDIIRHFFFISFHILVYECCLPRCCGFTVVLASLGPSCTRCILHIQYPFIFLYEHTFRMSLRTELSSFEEVVAEDTSCLVWWWEEDAVCSFSVHFVDWSIVSWALRSRGRSHLRRLRPANVGSSYTCLLFSFSSATLLIGTTYEFILRGE